MIRHHLITAVRNIRRHWVTAGVNVVGLSLGLLCFICALSIVGYYKLDNSQYPGADRTYFITQERILNKSSALPLVFPDAPWALGEELKGNVPQLELVARVRGYGKLPITVGTEPRDVQASFADAEFLNVFPQTFRSGDSHTALTRPRTAIVTEGAARQLFGAIDVVGRTVNVYGKEPITIDGVIAAPTQPSHLVDGMNSVTQRPFQMLLSMDMMFAVAALDKNAANSESQLRSWRFSPSVDTYVRLTSNDSSNLSALERALTSMAEQHALEGVPKRFAARPVSEIRQMTLDNLFERSTTGTSWSTLLLVIAGTILIVSCLNYANLATALASTHRREFGIRKVLGASTKQLVTQHLCESGLLLVAAAASALAVTLLIAPGLRTQYSIDLLYAWTHMQTVWQAMGCAFIVVYVAVSLLPIVSTLNTRNVEALGTRRSGYSSGARWLVGAQFMLTGILLISALVVFTQQRDLQRFAHESLPAPIVAIENSLGNVGVDFDVLRAELQKQPHIVSVTASGFSPWAQSYGLVSLSNSTEASASDFTVISEYVRHDYFSSLGIAVLAGQSFDQLDERPPANDSQEFAIVIDRTAALELGWKNPQSAVGKIIYPGQAFRKTNPAVTFRVVGVVENKLMQFTSSGATATVYMRNTKTARTPLVQLAKDYTAEGLAEIESVWRALAPNFILRRSFVDEYIDRYAAERATYTNLLLGLTLLALVISVSGLVGMSIFMANRRTHEIGVRKTLGARTEQIFSLLLRDFSKPVVAGNLIAWPTAYFIGKAYLSTFVHRISLSPALFIGSLGIALVSSFVAVAWYAAKSARLSPANVLRHE